MEPAKRQFVRNLPLTRITYLIRQCEAFRSALPIKFGGSHWHHPVALPQPGFEGVAFTHEDREPETENHYGPIGVTRG